MVDEAMGNGRWLMDNGKWLMKNEEEMESKRIERKIKLHDKSKPVIPSPSSFIDH